MSITSVGFFACLVPAVTLFHLLPARGRSTYLLVLSYAFYGMLGRGYVALLIGETLVTCLAGNLIASSASNRMRRCLLAFALAILCAPLISMKIWGSWQTLAAPIGLSYYTLRQISYLIEVYWDPSVRAQGFVRFALWVSFFPQIVSGPIQRWSQFLSEIEAPEYRRSDFERLEAGFRLILTGLFLKLVIADRLFEFLHSVEVDADLFPRWIRLLLCDANVLAIFADLAGYTNLALGIGLCFGIAGPPNFRAPFAASSIQEFWARWHMSLTGWLLDYVYTPLRFRLRSWKSIGMATSLLATMILIGLWHRVSTGALAFGVLHGGFMALSVSTLVWRDRFFEGARALRPFRRPLGLLITFHWVSLTQVFVDWPQFMQGLHRLGSLVHANATGGLAAPENWLPALVCGLFALLVGAGVSIAKLERYLRLPAWLSYGLALLVIVLLSASQGGPFIYAMF